MKPLQTAAIKALIQFYKAYLNTTSSSELAEMAETIFYEYHAGGPLLEKEIANLIYDLDTFMYHFEHNPPPTKEQAKKILEMLKNKLSQHPSKKR